jgi:enamine deaminase RidA (YjgF/YER057c/UK114 family)
MNTTAIDPWQWQRQFSYSQGLSITGAERVLFIAGQTSVDPDGRVLHEGDMAAQLTRAFDNLEAVLAIAGLTIADVVQLNYFTTDVHSLFGAWETVTTRLTGAVAPPTSTLLGVAQLAYPELLIEINAIALA